MGASRASSVWVVGLLAVSACSGSSTSGGNGSQSSTEQANPCATKGATYLETFAEISGDCGPVTSQVVNVSSDGTITTSSSVTCASQTQNGCTERATDCTFTSQGFMFTMTFETTFAQDGSSATGIETLNGSGNGQSCSSTYDVSMQRQ